MLESLDVFERFEIAKLSEVIVCEYESGQVRDGEVERGRDGSYAVVGE